MAATIKERFGRRTTLTFTAEMAMFGFLVVGATSENDAKATVAAGAPATVTGQKGTLRLSSIEATESTFVAGRYLCEATYELPGGEKNTGDKVFTFDTTGETQHILYSKATVATYPTNAASMKNAINTDGDTINGTDIVLPKFAFSATIYLATASFTQSYIAGLYALTGQVNNATWTPTIDGITLSFNEGEVLFMGATGSRRAISDAEINLHFAGSPNVTNLTVGDVTGIAKKGWELLWVFPKHVVVVGSDTNKTALASVPDWVYIEKVYDEGAFSATGL